MSVVAPGVFFNSLRNINGTNPGGRECCHPSAMLRLGVGGAQVIDLVTFSADILLREARGTELPVVDVPVTLETAAYEPRIVSMSIRPSVIEIEPGVDRQAVAAVEVEIPDAGLPPELNPGLNVTVSLYRVDGHGSVLVETTPCCSVLSHRVCGRRWAGDVCVHTRSGGSDGAGG
ncbi:MAG: hypothetical protein QXD59_02115 [Candidatus Caldarchaeum sp.]